MALLSFTATDFRCLSSVEVSLNPAANLIVGPNGAGKTSVLEGIGYLGRGKSFRGASTQHLVRHGQKAFVLLGKVDSDGRQQTVGVRNSTDGLEISVDGERGGGAAALAEVLPLQIIDPDVHDLIGGGPERRRRYLDWLTFHVEPGYLDLWRRFRRSLKQRNAALKGAPSAATLEGWDAEFSELSDLVAAARKRSFDIARPVLEETANELLEAEIGFEYRRGWPDDVDLRDLLREQRGRDVQQGITQSGPQRADIKLRYDERQARRLVSRGQQKLLACSMVLAATDIAQTALEKPLLLLLDDPAAELDSDSLVRLMLAVERLGCQVVATSLVADAVLFSSPPALFHVEQGQISPA